MIEEGDDNETVAAFQFLLNCSGYGDLTVDGNFGPATLAAVEAAQRALARTVNGAPDEPTFAALSRACSDPRELEADETLTVVGNAAPGDPEAYALALLTGSTVQVTLTAGNGLSFTLTGADGQEVEPQGQAKWAVEATQDYLLEVAAGDDAESATFTLTVAVTETEREVGDWVLATDGVIYKGTKLALGADADGVIDKVFDYLDHGVRGNLDEFDTDWYTITDPSDMGLRGIFIEGFAFLFYGPDPNNPDRPETFTRWRFVGSTVDADGNPRPDHYATTAYGITVGDTLADLKAVYGGDVRSGSNDEEFYYRYVDSYGDMCFYFDTENAPADADEITEMSSECRTG
jgi:peptidoglycan hydrolase-like protein with peptidoglycan-binding domain